MRSETLVAGPCSREAKNSLRRPLHRLAGRAAMDAQCEVG